MKTTECNVNKWAWNAGESKNMIVRRSDFLSFFGWDEIRATAWSVIMSRNSNQQKNRSSKKKKEFRDLDILNGNPDE